MALTKIHKLGTTKAELSILTNDADYTFNNTYKEYRNVKDARTLFDVVGTDYAPFFENCVAGVEYELFKFKDGSSIIFKCEETKSQTWGGNLFTYYYPDGPLVCRKSDGTEIGLGSYNPVYKVVRSGVTYKCQCFFALGLDDDLKYGYFMLILNEPRYGGGTVDTFGTRIFPANGYGASNFQESYSIFSGNGTEFDNDPWSNAGYAGIGGGDGTFDFASDIIGLPDIPTIDATNTGFLQLYSASLSQVRELAAYLWTNDFLTNLVKVTQDPLSIIMSLSMYPFAIPSTTTRRVCAGNVETPVSMAVPDKQFYEIDCGNFPVPSFYGAYLDYEPFSKCEIFLPYCGTHALSLDDIVGATLNVRYRVDLLSGSCVAFILVDGSVRYTFAGMCAMNIPITSQNFLSNYTAILGLAATSINALSAPTMSAASDVASNVMQCKPNISRGGGTASNMGFMGVQKPMLIFTVPRVAIPKGQAKHTGYPVFSTYKLSDLKGYTEIEAILTEDFGRATSAEVSEIEKLLKGGVIL